MPEENYFKDVKKRTFYIDWIPVLVVAFLFYLVAYIVFFMILHILFGENFTIGAYLSWKIFSFDTIMFPSVCIFFMLLWSRKNYFFTKKKPFASINSERLVLYFQRDSFQWESIQSVVLEGKRKLTVVYNDEGKSRKKVNDLKWLSKKEDFIYNLKNSCSRKNIPYREADMTYSSRIAFYLIIMKRFLFEPSLTGE